MPFAEFARKMFLVGCIGFGGGSALIPVIENIFLKKGKLDVKENYDKDVVVASLTPGALPIEIAGGLGRRNYGAKGMIAGAFSMALPGAIGTFLLLTLLFSAQEKVFLGLKIASVGICAFIIGLLLTYIGSVIKTGRKHSRRRMGLNIGVMCVVALFTCGGNLFKLLQIDRTPIFGLSTISVLIAVFFVAFYTNGHFGAKELTVSAVLCILFCLEQGKQGVLDIPWLTALTGLVMLGLALSGFIKNFRRDKLRQHMNGKLMIRDVLSWAVFFVLMSIPALLMTRGIFTYLGKAIVSVFMSFGGGDAYLTVADGLFVEAGMLSADAYYGEIVPIVNILPGSILCKTLLGVGYYIGLYMTGSFWGGLCFALAGLACSISMSCISFMVIYYLYEGLSDFKGFMLISRFIRPVISGLLINVVLSLLRQNVNAAQYVEFSVAPVMIFTAALAITDYFLLKKCNTALVLAITLAATVCFGAVMMFL